MSAVNPSWALAIFAAREIPSVLVESVRAAIIACAGREATIDVLINGNESLSKDFSTVASTIVTGNCKLRIWSIYAGDKAHTWNEYVHRIWDTKTIAFFIDGYVRVKPEALAAIERRLAEMPNALAASGVPSNGRSSEQLKRRMLTRGGIHGNLYALKGTSMDELRSTGFRLPLGLYRTDPMLGGALTFRLDPAKNRWTRGSVIAVADATWDVDGISNFNYKNVVGYFKRRLRQAQGALESKAFRDHMAVKRQSPQSLPGTAQDMVNNWLNAYPVQARSLFLRQPSCLYAARQLRKPRDWSKTEVPPVLLLQHST